MNEEKINLVLTDICGRLPHGVITKNCKNNFDVPAHLLPHVNGIKLLIAEYDLKPYLRPMSSMTEEEKFELGRILSIEHEDYLLAVEVPDIIDFYNQNHLDYRGLIEKGLALEAPEDMYKTE